jgi:hypothetical protein
MEIALCRAKEPHQTNGGIGFGEISDGHVALNPPAAKPIKLQTIVAGRRRL